MITIFGSDDFYQLRRVSEKLSAQSADMMIVDYKQNKELTLTLNETGRKCFLYDGVDLTRSDIVWRSDKYICAQFGDTKDWADDYTKNKIWKSTLDNIARTLDCPIVNSTKARQFCEHKLSQIQLAVEAGFNTPFSLISNSVDTIKAHSAQHGGLITKMMGDPHIPDVSDVVKQSAPPTVRIDKEYLEINQGKIEPFPLFIQKEIKKKLEYRCVFVDNHIFTLSIDPSQHHIMEVDHRLGGYMVDYKPFKLPALVDEKIREIAERIGLFSGCFDLIEDTNGEYFFLEVNHHGVWGLHDDIYDGDISSMFSEALLRLSVNSK